MAFHAVLLIQEPPSRAELDLAWARPILEIPQHGCHHLVVGWIQVVKDGLAKLLGGIQPIEKTPEGRGLRVVADGIEAGVGTQGAHDARAVVAHGPQVKLLRPAARMVHEGALVEHGRTELVALDGRDGASGPRLGEDVLDLLGCVRFGQDLFEAVVTDTTA